MNTDEEILNSITERIIGAAFKVHNTLGCGVMENVYHNAMEIELKKAGFQVLKEHEIPVYYDGIEVGKYFADLVDEGRVIVELKAIRALDEIHAAQCINYLAATGLPICLLINFGRRVEIKRLRGARESNDSSVYICASSVASK